jgi:excisionase family DNA binding protein
MLREWMKASILTTTEAAQILQVSRQRVLALVQEGSLPVLKETSGTNLFLRTDVERYLAARNGLLDISHLELPPNVIAFLLDGPSTAVKRVEELQPQFGDLHTALAYFDYMDAAMAGFYVHGGEDWWRVPGYGVEVARLVLRNAAGEEIWVQGANCGYGGGGPRTTERILRLFGVPEDVMEPLFSDDAVVIVHDGSSWQANSRHRTFRQDDATEQWRHPSTILGFDGRNLVLAESRHNAWLDMPKATLYVLERYAEFIPSPVEAIVFNDPQRAIESGYWFVPVFGHSQMPYRVILRDASGRELWLIGDDLDDSPASTVKDLLISCGLDVDEAVQSTPEAASKFGAWLRRPIPKAAPVQHFALKNR